MSSLGFYGPDRDHDLIIGIEVIQFFLVEFLRQPVEKGNGSQDIAMHCYTALFFRE